MFVAREGGTGKVRVKKPCKKEKNSRPTCVCPVKRATRNQGPEGKEDNARSSFYQKRQQKMASSLQTGGFCRIFFPQPLAKAIRRCFGSLVEHKRPVYNWRPCDWESNVRRRVGEAKTRSKSPCSSREKGGTAKVRVKSA